MKVFVFILSVFLLTSCSKDDFENQNDFEKSYKAFEEFKKENNNSYTYTTQTDSWVGLRREYTFEIKNGIVQSRTFAFTKIGSIKRPETGWTTALATEGLRKISYSDEEIKKLFNGENILSELEWTESINELGTKQNSYNIWTLDHIYDKAKNEWLIKRANSVVSFESNNNGLLSYAGYINKSCADDCFIGVIINSIKP